jgi:hypothetical protein
MIDTGATRKAKYGWLSPGEAGVLSYVAGCCLILMFPLQAALKNDEELAARATARKEALVSGYYVEPKPSSINPGAYLVAGLCFLGLGRTHRLIANVQQEHRDSAAAIIAELRRIHPPPPPASVDPPKTYPERIDNPAPEPPRRTPPQL